MKICTRCAIQKPQAEFGKHNYARCKPCRAEVEKLRYQYLDDISRDLKLAKARAYQKANRNRVSESQQRRRHTPEGAVLEMLTAARKRAKQDGVPFDMVPADIQIPELCPVFGIPLVKKKSCGPSPWSPSLDKIIPANGYTPKNTMVLSQKANAMKQNASPEELLMFADWIYKTFGLIRQHG